MGTAVQRGRGRCSNQSCGRRWPCPGETPCALHRPVRPADGLVPGRTDRGWPGLPRKTAGDAAHHPRAKALYLALRGRAWLPPDFSGVTLLLPKNAGLTELADQINSAWQKECSLFFSVEEVEQDEFEARIAAGTTPLPLRPSVPRRQRISDAAAVHHRRRQSDRLCHTVMPTGWH